MKLFLLIIIILTCISASADELDIIPEGLMPVPEWRPRSAAIMSPGRAMPQTTEAIKEWTKFVKVLSREIPVFVYVPASYLVVTGIILEVTATFM